MKKTITIFSVFIILHFTTVANEGHPNPNQRFVEKQNNLQDPIENPDSESYNHDQSLDHFVTPNDLFPNHSHLQNIKSNKNFTHRLDSIIEYNKQDSDNPTEKTYFEYYPMGDSLRIIWHWTTWDSWNNSWNDWYSDIIFDANGNRVEEISINQFFNSKINQSFDENNRLIEYSSYQRNSTEENWRGTSRYINTRHETGYIVNRLGYSWNIETADWVYSYNQKFEWVEINGSILNSSHLRENWNMELNEFQNFQLESYSYNEDGVFISYLRENWDNESGLWKNNHKQDYTINTAGLRILSLLYDWDITSQSWLANSRIEREYDDFGKLTKYLQQLYNLETDTFVNNRLEESQYTESENQIHISNSRYNWDIGLEIWKGENRADFEYVNGNVVNNYTFLWNETHQDWMNGYRTQSIYDDLYAEKSSIIQTVSYDWDAESAGWAPSNESFLTYRQDIFPENLLSNEIYSVSKPNKVREEINWIGISSSFFFQTVYYYTALENSTYAEKIDNSNFKVFPNPAKDHLTIAGLKAPANIEIYDLQGKLLLTQKVSENEIVEISSLSPGLYMYRIFEEQTKIKTGKLVKH